MAIVALQTTDPGDVSKNVINNNFSELETDKIEAITSSVDNNVVVFNGVSGGRIKDGGHSLSEYVPTTRKINGYDLSSDRNLTYTDVGAQVAGSYVPDSRTVNGKALSGNITLAATDLSASEVADKNKYLHSNSSTGNMEWSSVNVGDVVGPAVAVDNNVVTFNSTTGKLIKDSGITLTKQAIGFTVAGGTTSKTLTVALDANVSGTNTGDNAANSSSTYIGTTQVALNRASAALTLAGITLTTPDIGTPSAGNLANCTFPTLNQSTSGTAAGLSGTPSITVATVTTTGNIELGHASDTTIARVSAGVISVEGNNVITANQQVTNLAATAAGDKDKYLHANSSTGALEWSTVSAGGGDMVLASSQTVTGLKTFDKDKLAMKGTSTGVTTFSTANTSATSYTAILPAKDFTFDNITTGTTSNGTGFVKANGSVISFDNSTYATTAAASTSAAGLAPQATAPAAGLYNYVGITNGETNYSNKALFDATVPSTQAFGDAAATGSATVAARRDHKHAMMAAPTTVTGSAGSLKSNATTGVMQIAGPATGQTRVMTIPDADSTLLVSGGALGTPASGTLTNCTGMPTAGITGKLTDGSNADTLHVHASAGGTKIYLNTANASGATLYSTTITGGTLSTNNAIRITCFANISHINSADTFTLNLNYGGGVVLALTQTEANRNYYAKIEFYIYASGATNTQEVTGFFQSSQADTGVILFDANTGTGFKVGTGAVDSTTNQTLSLSYTSSAGNTLIECYNILIESIK